MHIPHIKLMEVIFLINWNVLAIWLPRIILSSAAQEVAKSSEFDLTSYAPQQLQIFPRSLYNIIMLQNNQNQIKKYNFDPS